MIQTTRAVVLRAIRHVDKSTVLRAYTELFGLRSYMVRTGTKGDGRRAALQPLTRVELVVPESVDHGMRTVRDIRIERPYVGVQRDAIRGMLLLFTQEVLNRTLREESPDGPLFRFVQGMLEEMDTGSDPVHYPLLLLIGLMGQLGFSPEPPGVGEHGFDLREGCFFRGEAPHELCMGPASSALFTRMLAEHGTNWSANPTPPSTAMDRRRLLDDLALYFRLHVEGFGELRSLEVIRTILH